MAEQPVKIFATRAERYPEPGVTNETRALVKSGLAAIPAIGGALSELIDLVISPSLARRRDDWLRELANALEALEARVEGFRLENLAGNEAFVSATIQATRIAVGTHQREKREMLRNTLLQVASGRGPAEDLQQVYFNAIEAFSPSHLRVLKAFWTGLRDLAEQERLWTTVDTRTGVTRFSLKWGEVIAKLYPDLGRQNSLLQHIIVDLRIGGFSNVAAPEDMISNSAITNLGIEFLQFVLDEQH